MQAKEKNKGTEELKKAGRDLIHSDKLWWTFVRSAISSQLASWLDLLLGFLLFTVAGMSPFWSAAFGAIAGGVFNCIINYRFTFHATGCPWKAVAVKYAMVWLGSVILNSYGTELVYLLMSKWDLILSIELSHEMIYALARLFVSLAVSLVWNFILQRYFVYRVTRFDPYAINFINYFTTLFRRKSPAR